MASQQPPSKKTKLIEGSPADHGTLLAVNDLMTLLKPITQTLDELRNEVSDLKKQGKASFKDDSTQEPDKKQNPGEEEEFSEVDDDNKSTETVKWLKIFAHCKDSCEILVYDENDEEIASYDGYPPDFLNEHGAVALKIDIASGTIMDWKKPTSVEILSSLCNN